MSKIQELTEQLYQEGLAKGKQEGEAFLEKARAEADRIVREADEKAAAIVAKAEKDAEDLRTKVESDLRMAARQSITATRADIENLIIAKTAGEGVSAALSDGKFLKEVILEVAKKFSSENTEDIALILPESLRKDLEPFVSGELSKVLGKGVEAEFSKKVAGGFKIGPKDGSYLISMTDETYSALIGEYLRPTTKKLLFG